MPYEWVEPEVFVERAGMVVYRRYDDDSVETPMKFWFTTDQAGVYEDDEFAFDVRGLATWDWPGDPVRAIEDAIDQGLLKFPDGVEPTEPEKSHWDDDQEHSAADWQYEVANGDTRLGYAAWVEQRREATEND